MPQFFAIRDAHTFVDLQGVTVHYYSWLPGKPKAIVLLVHGIGEHALRYEHVAQRLVRAGYGVYAIDQRGHGATGLQQAAGDASRLGDLGRGGLRAVDDDMVMLLKRIRGLHPALPLGIIGHSWGSFMTQRLLNRHSALVDAAMLSGSALRLPGSLNAGSLNRNHAHLGDTGLEWLSRDPVVVQAFVEDPLTYSDSLQSKFGLATAAQLFGIPKRNIRPAVPLLIAVGSDDSVGGPRSVRRLATLYRDRAGFTDVTVTVYPGLRHEIFNEISKEKVLDDTVAWFDAKLLSKGAADATA